MRAAEGHLDHLVDVGRPSGSRQQDREPEQHGDDSGRKKT